MRYRIAISALFAVSVGIGSVVFMRSRIQRKPPEEPVVKREKFIGEHTPIFDSNGERIKWHSIWRSPSTGKIVDETDSYFPLPEPHWTNRPTSSGYYDLLIP